MARNTEIEPEKWDNKMFTEWSAILTGVPWFTWRSFCEILVSERSCEASYLNIPILQMKKQKPRKADWLMVTWLVWQSQILETGISAPHLRLFLQYHVIYRSTLNSDPYLWVPQIRAFRRFDDFSKSTTQPCQAGPLTQLHLRFFYW